MSLERNNDNNSILFIPRIQLLCTLEDHIQQGLQLFSDCSSTGPSLLDQSIEFWDLRNFYCAPPFHHKQIKFSSYLLTKQLFEGLYNPTSIQNSFENSLLPLLYTCDLDIPSDPPSQICEGVKKPSYPANCSTMLVNDTDLSTLTSLIAQQLQRENNQIQSSVSQPDSTPPLDQPLSISAFASISFGIGE